MSDTLVLEGRAAAGQTLSFVYLPFDMPPNVERLEVRYEYSAAIGSDPMLTGGNTVDIGIFDPRGVAEGFRGWSGSARREFFLASDEATPGYMPGPLLAGQWHIVLGLYKVAAEGCHYRVSLTLDKNGAAKPVDFPRLLALSSEARPDVRKAGGWYRGELHCHTYHSDGDSDPLEVVRRAEALGLDFLAITDHNVVSHQSRLAQADTRLMLIPGMEVTTYKGHWNVWGDGGWVDFRLLTEAEMQQAVDAAVHRGFVVSCNHPRPYGPEWVFTGVDSFHCVEVWNGPWEIFNAQSLEFWEKKLRAGRRYPAVGGSDSHFLHREHIAKLGHPTTWIYCEGDPSPAALLAGLRRGQAFITEAPDGPELYLQVGGQIMGDAVQRPQNGSATASVRAVGAAGMTLQIITEAGCASSALVENDDQRFELQVDVRRALYIRAQLVGQDAAAASLHALTNPIYFNQS